MSFCFSLFVATSTFARWSFQCFWAFQSSFNLFLWSWVKFVHQRICKFTSLIHIESEYICDVYFYWYSIKYYGFQIFVFFLPCIGCVFNIMHTDTQKYLGEMYCKIPLRYKAPKYFLNHYDKFWIVKTTRSINVFISINCSDGSNTCRKFV